MEPSSITFSAEKCTSCGLCIKECPSNILEMNNNLPYLKHSRACIRCGHCVSVCPSDAIVHHQIPENDFEILPPKPSNPDDLLLITKYRRSCRNFKPKEIEPAKIEMILNEMRYIPLAKNGNKLEYLIINSRQIMRKIQFSMEKWNRILGIFVKISRVYTKKAKDYRKSGNDFDYFLRGAPAMMIIVGPKNHHMDHWDAGIASYHLTLVAEAYGLSTCLCGYHLYFAKYLRSVRKASLIPKGKKILATVLLGYPAVKYRKAIKHKPMKVHKFPN